jgi:hypothetical protein
MLDIQTKLVCCDGDIVRFLGPIQSEERLRKIDDALERGGIFLAV